MHSIEILVDHQLLASHMSSALACCTEWPDNPVSKATNKNTMKFKIKLILNSKKHVPMAKYIESLIT